MPAVMKSVSYLLSILIFLSIFFSNWNDAIAQEGLKNYYIRYDIKSSKHKIVDANLLMIPAKEDFRAEEFLKISTSGVIFLTPGESKNTLYQLAKEQALKSVLEKKGLKSVKTKDSDTVISYEGAVITPVEITEKSYNEDKNTYHYEAKIEFSPIAFPDKWKSLGMKYKIKRAFTDFLELFK